MIGLETENIGNPLQGLVITIGSHYIKSWSKNQSVIVLSSAQAELYGIIKTSSATLGIISILKDWNLSYKADIMADASAALGIIGRTGLGKLRRIDTSYLWLQQESIKKAKDEQSQWHRKSSRYEYQRPKWRRNSQVYKNARNGLPGGEIKIGTRSTTTNKPNKMYTLQFVIIQSHTQSQIRKTITYTRTFQQSACF